MSTEEPLRGDTRGAQEEEEEGGGDIVVFNPA